ncbi:MAG: protein translocase subunit SecD, partial [Phaeodactylibacter sp.]|nr:protein translocase subunit SecD [Phaeodactylibacter sp.]
KKARSEYIDSMNSEVVFTIPLIKKYTYQELKGQQLALGLDLKGGMSVVMQVDLREFIRALANDSKDPTFIKALDQASEALKSAQSDYVTLFADEWRKIADGKKLASIFRRSQAINDQITANTSDGEMTRILREAANETVNLTYSLLKKRIDKLGVTQPNVSLDAARDLIIVELPGVDNPERARSVLVAVAKLEFWETYRINDRNGRIQQGFLLANEELKKTENYDNSGDTTATEAITVVPIDTTYVTDELGNIVDSSQYTVNYDTLVNAPLPGMAQQGPLFEVFELNTTGALGLTVMGTADRNQKDDVMAYLNRPEIKKLFPDDLVFRWSRNPTKDVDSDELTNRYELYAIKMARDGKPPLTGDRVIRASADPDPQTGEMGVSLAMDRDGARSWGQLTQKAYNQGNREIAIVLDDEVVSAPRVINPILNGNSSITGSFTTQEANDLASILEIGKLPATPEILEDNLVGPSLGKDNINRSVKALVFGFVLVFLFMVMYYSTGGIVSILSLILNIFFIFGSLASIGTVLTLPGVAGIVLTIGMAVDANVIIYERIREELREGKSLTMAIQDGFKNSYSAIIDANVTTILTAIVLAYFGLGPIKGFAVVLIIGVLSSLFTAVLVGRLIIDWWTQKRGKELSFWTGMSKNAFADLQIDWLGKRRIAYTVSGLIIALGIVAFFFRGFELGIDFKGGYSYNVEFAQDVEAQQLREALDVAFEGASTTVKAVDLANTYNVVTSYNINDTENDAADKVMAKLFEGIKTVIGGDLTQDKFSKLDAEGITHITSSSKVGPTIADDIQSSSVYATVFALLLIFLYIFIRFSKWQYSLGAVAALFHDVLITLGIFSLFHGILPFSMEIDQAFIAAILTVIGYSINDTVVV